MLRRASVVAWLWIFLIAVFLAPEARPSAFDVQPVRIEILPSRRSAALKISNRSGEPLTVQTSVMKWSLQDAKQTYAEVDDFVLNPPIFTVAPHSSQVVRLGPRAQQFDAVEKSYRLILTEVPGPLPIGFSGTRTVLRISVPIFIRQNAVLTNKISWEAWLESDGSITIDAENQGTSHVQFERLQLTNSGKSTMRTANQYALPQEKVEWKCNEPEVRGATQITVAASTDAGDINEVLAVKHR
jgi:fimbrial chaperone protein